MLLTRKWFVELLKMDFDVWPLLVSFEKPGITGNVGSLRTKHTENILARIRTVFTFLSSLCYCDYQTENETKQQII